MQHIVICSEDTLFASALSAAIASDFSAQVTHVENAEGLAKLTPSTIHLVISTMPLSSPGKSLYYSAGNPRRLQQMLSDIRKQLATKTDIWQPLTNVIMLDTNSRNLRHEGTGSTQELTEKEQALLLFIKEQGEASREEILAAVWGFGQDIDTHTLETHLYRLRGKWRELADFDCIAATDKGYRWYGN